MVLLVLGCSSTMSMGQALSNETPAPSDATKVVRKVGTRVPFTPSGAAPELVDTDQPTLISQPSRSANERVSQSGSPAAGVSSQGGSSAQRGAVLR